MTAALTDADVCTWLSISGRTLRRLITDTPAGIKRPWLTIQRSRRWMGGTAAIETWLREVERWRASENTAQAGRSAGSSPTDRRPPVEDSAPKAPPKRQRGRSTTASPPAAGGSLVTLAQSLTSGK